MRQLEASIRTFNLDRVKVSLSRFGVSRFEVAAVPLAPAGVHGVDFLPRIRVQVTVPDAVADQVAELLRDAS